MAHILVVDDEDDMVGLMRMALQKDGHKVTEAFDGKEALKKLGIEPEDDEAPIPDLIITDVMMPQVNGFDLGIKLNENQRTRQIPLLVLTAKGGMEDSFKLNTNIKDYLSKPFDQKKLRALVSKIIAPAQEVKVCALKVQYGSQGDGGKGDQIIEQILNGVRKAVASPKALFEPEQLQELYAMAGKDVTIMDKDDKPRCNIRVLDIFETTFGDPDPRVAAGTGYELRPEAFKTAHMAQWQTAFAKLGLSLQKDTVLVAQLFEVSKPSA